MSSKFTDYRLMAPVLGCCPSQHTEAWMSFYPSFSLRRASADAMPGRAHDIGEGFRALHFSEAMFEGRMDPLIMVDHYVMTEHTFDAHPHAGISAVSLLLEDAQGDFVNRDTLGNHVALKPGDLYWLMAARGAVHEERPGQADARIHGLQIFVNLPAARKFEAPQAFHVKAGEMPVLEEAGYRVRLAHGRSGATQGPRGAPEDITILEGRLDPNGAFAHDLPGDFGAWIYAIDGAFTVARADWRWTVDKGKALALTPSGAAANLVITSGEGARFAVISARPLRERFVKHGPLVMSTEADVRATLKDYAAGRLGRLD